MSKKKKEVTIDNAIEKYLKDNKAKHVVFISEGNTQETRGDVFVVDYDNACDIDESEYETLNQLIDALKWDGVI